MYKINCYDCHTSYIGETGRDFTTRLIAHNWATRKGDVNNQIAEHHRLMNHTIDLTMHAMPDLQHQLLSRTDPGKLVY